LNLSFFFLSLRFFFLSMSMASAEADEDCASCAHRRTWPSSPQVMTRWFCNHCQPCTLLCSGVDTYVIINEEVANDFISMSSGEVHCTSHVEGPARVQRHESKARRSTWSLVIVFCCHRPPYLRRVSSSDVS
jgi:hypothetical protein